MSKTKKLSKVLALVIMLALVIGILPMGAMASNGYTDETIGAFTFQFGDPTDPRYANTSPERDMVMSKSGSTVTVTYNGSTPNYFPDRLAFYITAGASGITSMSGTGVTIAPTELNGEEYETTTNLQAGFYVLYIDTTTAGTKTMNFTNGTDNVTMNFSVPSGSTTQAKTIYAYLPAPGQFPNEGVTTGGWGDAYTSNSASIKNMVDNLVGTGVSLGYFGGYVVIDMLTDVPNDPANMYGIDFIVYGNAFIGNSEPGCLQVSPDGVNWYDIAGSLHYDSDTAWDAEFTYTNPYPSDDASTTIPTPGYYDPTSGTTNNDVYYDCTPNDGAGNISGYVYYNTFHRHAWFPLWANYFIGRGSDSAMAKASLMDSSGYVTLANLPFAKYYHNTTTGSKLTLTGVMLKDATNTQTGTYRFGYADVHPKNNTTGYFKKQYNPYAFTDTNIGSSTAWNNYLSSACNGSNAGGGDPIDISWAVYPSGSKDVNNNDISGNPVYLSSIRYIRVYTGAASMNQPKYLGEISTEVCGVYVADGVGSGAADSDLYVVNHNSDYVYVDAIGDVEHQIAATPNQSTIPITFTNGMAIDVFSDADYVYINGVSVSCSSVNAYQFTPTSGGIYQIITQSGTESPYIVVLTVS